IRDSVRNDDDVDRHKNEIPFLRNTRNFMKEWIEVRDNVGRGKPFFQFGLDLRYLFSFKFVDWVKAFRLTHTLPTQARHKHGLRLLQVAEFVDMPIDIMGEERQSVFIMTRTPE